jgi:hypothetical protein
MAPQPLEKIESRLGNGMGSEASDLLDLVRVGQLENSLELRFFAVVRSGNPTNDRARRDCPLGGVPADEPANTSSRAAWRRIDSAENGAAPTPTLSNRPANSIAATALRCAASYPIRSRRLVAVDMLGGGRNFADCKGLISHKTAK